MTHIEALKPCPFCGAKPEYDTTLDQHEGVTRHTIRCGAGTEGCPTHPITWGVLTKAEAIDLWNTRIDTALKSGELYNNQTETLQSEGENFTMATSEPVGALTPKGEAIKKAVSEGYDEASFCQGWNAAIEATPNQVKVDEQPNELASIIANLDLVITWLMRDKAETNTVSMLKAVRHDLAAMPNQVKVSVDADALSRFHTNAAMGMSFSDCMAEYEEAMARIAYD